MKIGVIVSSYNRPRYLARCLESLAGQRRLPDEIVVADDGSSPDLQAECRALCAAGRLPARFVTHEHRGFRLAAARNLGIRAARADYLLITDCDILLGPEAVAAHEAAAQPGRFIVGDRAWLDQAATEAVLAQGLAPDGFERLWEQADRSHLARVLRKFRRHQIQRRLGLAQRHKPQILGCHFSLFRSDLEGVNGFDERYEGWGHEDDDLSLRLYMAGRESGHVIREARAVHLWHPTDPSRQGRISPNRAYFRRRLVAARCERGLA